MQSMVRLALSGLLLERSAYHQQRDAPDGLRQGLLLVVLIGLLLGLVNFINTSLASLINPAPADAARVIFEELAKSPWYTAQPADVRAQLSPEALTLVWNTLVPGVSAGALSLLITPLLHLIAWLFFGLFAHVAARALGGTALLRQTLSCTALASGAQLPGLALLLPQTLAVPLLNVVPTSFGLTQSFAISLLTVIANYVAIREAHQLAPWRAFWATLLGPLLLFLLFLCGYCAYIGLLVQQAG
jgi:hypothetical protein